MIMADTSAVAPSAVAHGTADSLLKETEGHRRPRCRLNSYCRSDSRRICEEFSRAAPNGTAKRIPNGRGDDDEAMSIGGVPPSGATSQQHCTGNDNHRKQPDAIGKHRQDADSSAKGNARRTKVSFSRAKQETPTKAIYIGPPFHPRLMGDAVRTFRINYIKFRLGCAHGARGEFVEVMGNSAVQSDSSPKGCRFPLRSLASTIFRISDDSKSETAKGEASSRLVMPTQQDASLRADHTGINTRIRVCDEDGMDETNCHDVQSMLRIITEYRSMYQAFRRGGTRLTARNISDLADLITEKHLELLPITQHRRYLSPRSSSPSGETAATGKLAAVSADVADRQSAVSDLLRKQSRVDETPNLVTLRQPRKTKLHVHFGGGKLGLGLICPALVNSQRPFAIVDPPQFGWQPLIDGGADTVEVVLNKQTLATLRIVRPGGVLPQDFEACLERRAVEGDSQKELPRLLVCLDSPADGSDSNRAAGNQVAASSDEKELRRLLSMATSFSTSVGPAIADIGARLKKFACKHDGLLPTLYGCENDHASVERLGEELVGFVDVVTCMVDRICTDKIVTKSQIEVSTEPDHGNVVVLTPSSAPSNQTTGGGSTESDDATKEGTRDDAKTTNAKSTAMGMCFLPAFGGPNVSIPQSSAEAHYFANRKLTIVNGTHATLAFMTLCLKNKAGDDTLQNHTLLTLIDLDEARKQEVWAWAVGRILLLLWQHDLRVIKHAHGLREDEEVIDVLLAYAKRCLNRFSTIHDTTARVLGRGTARNWTTRLKNVDSFLMSTDVAQLPLGRRVLSKAEVGEGFLLRSVRRLCQDSYRFTNLSVIDLMS